ncbi:helix-turn-helix domain-containing protein [Streptomyces iconiensis]|uniref:Helix-turn-helix transcriptional regulator n=1 Tax=Streptomyces iconiensis TaxID=1384038 RepID=A0ABT6ZXV6_9ACTN|nr:helix-turn-helix transcriptional regulator [Streptomyces iconiensis]MDJ1133900.1 helix-turn-helix transcriptional regulator [Streptomyces iconiensis]
MTDYDERWGSGEPESSDSLREFGSIVQSFREHRGFTQEQAAPLIGYSPHTLRSVEQGRRFPPHDFPRRADATFMAFNTIIKAARYLSRNPGLAAWFRMWARMEREAISLCTYECRIVPGLLQTEAYMRASFQSSVPPQSDARVEAQIATRLDRQRMLRERQETAFSFIVEEALFLRRTGGADVTRELIESVLDLMNLRNIDVQVMPLVRENHSGLDGPLQLLETPDSVWYAYCEGQRGGFLVSDAKEVSVLQLRYARMRSQALTPEDTVSLLTQMRGAL